MKETERFVSMFDQFFDCLNVRKWIKKRKPDLKPHYKADDPRLEVSKHTVVTEKLCGASGHTDPSADAKNMMLSRETLEGLRITCKFNMYKADATELIAG